MGRFPTNEATRKTQNEVTTRAKQYGLEFVTYPANFDFNQGKQRFISAEDREKMFTKQNKLLIGNPNARPPVKSDFDQFIERLDRLNIDEEIKVHLYDMVYFTNSQGQKCFRPYFSLALQSGADINLSTLEKTLASTNGDLDDQRYITNQFFGQIIFAAIKGSVRGYYSELIAANQGYESKASKSFMDYYNKMINYVKFNTDASAEEYPQIIKDINNTQKALSQNRTRDNASDLTLRLNKVLDGTISRQRLYN